MTKREVLIAICEAPGWQPPEDASSIDRYLHELRDEGWVVPRLDGFEATPAALDAYPHFMGQRDIAGSLRAPENGGVQSDREHVPIERVTVLLHALLHDMPFSRVVALANLRRSQLAYDEVTWTAASELAKRMAQ